MNLWVNIFPRILLEEKEKRENKWEKRKERKEKKEFGGYSYFREIPGWVKCFAIFW